MENQCLSMRRTCISPEQIGGSFESRGKITKGLISAEASCGIQRHGVSRTRENFHSPLIFVKHLKLYLSIISAASGVFPLERAFRSAFLRYYKAISFNIKALGTKSFLTWNAPSWSHQDHIYPLRKASDRQCRYLLGDQQVLMAPVIARTSLLSFRSFRN